jgi:hypothetical protein
VRKGPKDEVAMEARGVKKEYATYEKLVMPDEIVEIAEGDDGSDSLVNVVMLFAFTLAFTGPGLRLVPTERSFRAAA